MALFQMFPAILKPSENQSLVKGAAHLIRKHVAMTSRIEGGRGLQIRLSVM